MAGSAAAAEYELHIIEALSTFGIPECYTHDVNDAGTAVGFMTYTTTLPSGSMSTSYKGYTWTPAGGSIVDTATSSIDTLNNTGDLVAGSVVRYISGSTAVIPGIGSYANIRPSAMTDTGMVVGAAHWRSTSNQSYDRAFYWTPATGTVDVAQFVPAASMIHDTNESGQVVGYVSVTSQETDTEAFYYDTVTGTHVDLHLALAGSSLGTSNAYAINNTGVVVGQGWDGAVQTAYTWSLASGFEYLPGLQGGLSSNNTPLDINDENIVVGAAAPAGTFSRVAYRWSPSHGIEDLNDLVDPVSGFILDRAVSISNSGNIAGYGHFGPGFGTSRGFVLVPIDSTCYADCDTSGSVDIFDYICFGNEYAAMAQYADCDSNGTWDIFDYICFGNAYSTGCP